MDKISKKMTRVDRTVQMGIKCWVCVIFFARVVVSKRLRGRAGGLEGGPLGPPSGGARGRSPPRGVRGQRPRNFFFSGRHISGTT
jgi:hypothetical protein